MNIKPLLIFFMFTGFLFAAGCNSKEKKEEGHEHTAAGEYYTCPMHPQIRSDKTGTCPICNMTLVKVSATASKNETGITLTDQQRKLANIQTYKVDSGKIGTVAMLTGKVVQDQNAAEIITSRVPGRIDKLLVRSVGQKVRKGQALYQIYSEQLLAAQQEYLLALQHEDLNIGGLKSELAASSREKLALWGMTTGQIQSLGKTGKPNSRLTYFSPVAGNVMDVLAQEGSYVSEGSPLLRLVDLNSVWVQAQLYPGETGLKFKNEGVKIVAEAFPHDTLTGRLELNSPILEKGQQVNLATFRVENKYGKGDGKYGKLKQGMMAYVFVRQQAETGIMLPKSAIIPGKMPTVWIEKEDLAFEPRMVQTGAENKEWVEIKSGVKSGETVVVQGAYLLNSEYILKKGVNPMSGHSH